MQVDYLIIGQGISGTWLSYYLQKEKKSFLVIDDHNKNSSSKIAAGIINPVTGRRHVTVWMAEEIIPFAWNEYNQLGSELGIIAITQKNIIDFFPSPQMRLGFLKRVEEDNSYVNILREENQFSKFFQYEFGCGEIQPVYTAHLETLLPAWRQRLKSNNQILTEEFDIAGLIVSKEKFQYKHIISSAIIFCDGVGSAHNHFFRQLPFAPNKGEVLLVDIPGLPKDRIYKRGMMLVPLMNSENLWWFGSNYAWEYEHNNPTQEFREKSESLLQNWLKIPFRIVEHITGIRPATLERRPFVGLHPQYSKVGIINGMGTKGCSLAPFFAKKFVENLLYNKPITPEADMNRFSKLLSR